jgi:TatD DNase family protein
MNSYKYIDIHTHTFYEAGDTDILLNVFAHDKEALLLPANKSVGLHPWHIEENNWKQQFTLVENAVNEDGVIAVGEAGLDRAIKTDYNLQNEIFRSHIMIAEQKRKPLIIHCVRSYSEMLSYRKKSDLSVPWIFHWYNADMQIASELVRKNCYLSFGHMLFNEQSRAFRSFKEIPAEFIFFETDDAGYSIQQVYEKAALLRNMSIDKLKMRIMDNFTACFHP